MTLEESIKRFGVLNHVIVASMGCDIYQIIDGNNRVGCVPANFMVPCYVTDTKEYIDIPKNKLRRHG